MRSCIYCGKELEKGEKCNCPGAMKSRNANQSSTADSRSTSYNTEKKEEKTYNGWQESTYQTGYTKETKKKFRDRFKFKRKTTFRRNEFKGAASGVKGFTGKFMRDPVNTVTGVGTLSMLQIAIIIVLTSVVLSCCGFFAVTRLVSPFVSGANAVMPGINIGYHIGDLFLSILGGTAFLTIIGYLYLLVLYLINRFILRSNTPFSTLAIRPAAAMIPMMVFGILGVAVNFFSVYAMVMLLMTGIVIWIVLTYEGMRAEWSYVSASRVMYLVALSYFALFVVIFNIFRII